MVGNNRIIMSVAAWHEREFSSFKSSLVFSLISCQRSERLIQKATLIFTWNGDLPVVEI